MLVESLEEMAKRWAGPHLRHQHATCLAGRYSAQLKDLHERCKVDPEFTVDVLGYSTDAFIDPAQSQSSHENTSTLNGQELEASRAVSSFSAHQPRLDVASVVQPSPTCHAVEHSSPDELSAISTMLMDQNFMQMDRVISFDDMMFTAQTANDGATLPQNGWFG